MPDVFDRFFADFGKKTTDYYELVKLSPAYRVYFGVDEFITIADNLKSKLLLNPLKKSAVFKFITEAKATMTLL
jgi:phytoene desaturase